MNGLVSQATPLNLREKGGLVTMRTASCTGTRNQCATNQFRDFEFFVLLLSNDAHLLMMVSV